MQCSLNLLTQCLVFAGNHCCGQRMFGDFPRQIGPGQHADTRLRDDLFEDLTHELEALRFDTLGQAHQHLAIQARDMRRQHRAQGTRWQGDEDQFAGVEHRRQVGDRLDFRTNLDALEVAGVFTIDANGLSLLRIAHPLTNLMAVLGQQIGNGRTEAATAKHRDGLLCGHKTIHPEPFKWRCRHYTEQHVIGQRQSCSVTHSVRHHSTSSLETRAISVNMRAQHESSRWSDCLVQPDRFATTGRTGMDASIELPPPCLAREAHSR